jgi:16S rRNA (cytosine967-C5)-methyltransferase
MAELQRRLLLQAASLVKVGGLLIFSTCSLEPEEGVGQIADFLALNANFQRLPVVADEIGGDPDWITPKGELRTLPFQLQEGGAVAGMDGFYVARLRRTS